MGKARDTAGNIWEIDPEGKAPPRLLQPAQQQPNPMFANPKLPYEVQSAQGAAAAAPLEAPRAAADLARTQQQVAAQPLQNAHTQAETEQAKTQVKNTAFDNVNNLRNQFEKEQAVQDYKTVLPLMDNAFKLGANKAGDLNLVYAFGKAMDPNSVVREGEQVMATNVGGISEKVKGYLDSINGKGQLTPTQRTQLIEEIRHRSRSLQETYNQRRQFYSEFAQHNGINPTDVVGPHPGAPFRADEQQYIDAHKGDEPQQELAQGATRSQYDPDLSSKVNALIHAGAPYSQAAALAKQAGYPAPDPNEYRKAVSFALQHPEYRKSLAEATRTVPTTGLQRFAASPAGSFISGAGKAATLGFGDEMAASVMPGDYNTNRDAFAANQSVLAATHPEADLAGQVAGGFAAGAGLGGITGKIPGAAEGLFGARTPLPSLLNRGAVAGDAAFSGGYGAGSDNEDRLGGALQGLKYGIPGGIAARGTVNGLASAISPTGGAMRPLYDMGVRPSIGQRIGGPVNNLEEKLQSIPLVGDAIKGTRDRARDRYQIGLFNDALGKVGSGLPVGTKPGHLPHAIAQETIGNAYDNALSNMNAVPDQQMAQDIGALQKQVGGLRAESKTQFDKLWTGSVARRFQDGQLTGPSFKDAVSEMKAKSAAIRKSPTGDTELADALDSAVDALKGSAVRNSPPEAVHALNNADAAYSRLVRIEDASRKAGEPAEFSPSQYNTAVKTASGGVRNRAYLRGDALNTDIAALGTRLGDKVSNSGTVDRLAAGGMAYGVGALNPYAAGVMGGLGAVNAPGVRNVVTELMAPRDNPIFDRTAEELRRRARLAGMFGAPLALDYGQQ